MAYGYKTGGRRKGTPNKINKKLKQFLESFLTDNLDQLMIDLNECEPKDRVKFYMHIMQFVIPKIKAIEIKEPYEPEEKQCFIIGDQKIIF